MTVEKIKKVIELNNFLDEHLNIGKIKQNFAKQVIYKIVFENLLRYKNNFSIWDNQIDLQKFEAYLKEITDFVYENIYLKEIIKKKDILKLHYLIMKDLPLEKINNSWIFRQSEMKIHWHNTAGKLITTFPTKPKYIEKEFDLQINDLNSNLLNWNKSEKLLSIIIFIHNVIDVIHPFENGNWKVFRILLDVLLFKLDFFPVFVLKKEHRKKIFNKVISNYLDNKKKEVFLIYFLNLMIDIYSNYKI